MAPTRFHSITSNNNLIILLSVYVAGLYALVPLGLSWYVKSPSLVDEIFYLAVVIVLTLKNYHELWGKKIYKFLLGGHLALAICNIHDALSATGVKANYLFIGYTDCEFGEIEAAIYANQTQLTVYAVVMFALLSALFGWALTKLPDWLHSDNPKTLH